MMPDETISADDLIRLHGDQAYHEGAHLFSQAIEAKELELARGIADALRKLHKRRYHQYPRKEAHAG